MKPGTKRRLAIAAAVVAAAYALLHLCAPFYVGGRTLTARVVDSESGEPVIGALVEVAVYVDKPYFLHGSEIRQVFKHSTHTDENGRFSIPAWGPVPVERGWRYGHLGPSLSISKEGYSAGEFGRSRGRGDPPSTTYPFGTVATDPEWKDLNVFLARTGHRLRAPWDNTFYRQVYPDAPRPGLTIHSSG